MSQPTVSRLLARVERRMAARFADRVGRTKARQTAQLETIASEAFGAWLESKELQRIEKAVGGVLIVETRSHQADPALLAQVRGALADIRKIWGMDAPSEIRCDHGATPPQGLCPDHRGPAMTPAHQGTIKAPSRHQESAPVVVGAVPIPDRGGWLRARIVRLIDAGVPRQTWDKRDGWAFRGEYRHRPGSLSWFEVRQRIGGAVRTPEFVAAVDDLIAAGELIEVWLNIGGRRSAPHSLLLPGRSDSLKHPVARARGLPEVLAAEPWYAGLVGADPPPPPVHTKGA